MIQHLACIMDGNRRWATKRGQPSWTGHRAGVESVEKSIEFCLKHKIPYLSLYTFSLENFNRTAQEKSYLFDMIINQTEHYLSSFIDRGVKVKFFGDLSKFPDSVQKMCKKAEEKTLNGSTLQCNFLFGYGGRQEIVFAVKSLINDKVDVDTIDQEKLSQYLWTKAVPDPDLIIRTGGVRRISNFLLYQGAYAEIRFLDTLWPDLTEEEIFEAVSSATHAQKNFGS